MKPIHVLVEGQTRGHASVPSSVLLLSSDKAAYPHEDTKLEKGEAPGPECAVSLPLGWTNWGLAYPNLVLCMAGF